MFTHCPLFTPLALPDEIKRRDQLAKNVFKMPEVLLIENAAREAYHVLTKAISLHKHTEILIFIGKGHNGADGVALARLLHNLSYKVLVLHTQALEEAKGACKEHILMAQHLGVNFLQLPQDAPVVVPLEWRNPDIVIDAICGVGLQGNLRLTEWNLVRYINLLAKYSFIFSLDIPTGLSAISGKPMPDAVTAHATVTFEVGKPGLYLPDAVDYVGKVYVCPIGLPAQLLTEDVPSWQLLAPTPGDWVKSPPQLYKSLAGKVLIIGGSGMYTGAPVLAALGAFRTGAGIVHIACPKSLCKTISTILPECILHGFCSDAEWEEDCINDLEALIVSINPGAIVLGPGMGRTKETQKIIRHLITLQKRPPFIIDADALSFFYISGETTNENIARQQKNTLIATALLQSQDILTPHSGEFSRILANSFTTDNYDPSPDENIAPFLLTFKKDRSRALTYFCENCLAALVLKGPYTLIGQQTFPITLAPFDVPVLATAGSGDVLTGIIAALVTQHLQPQEAAGLAVYLHAQAGILLQKTMPKGVLASDIAHAIPLIWADLARE